MIKIAITGGTGRMGKELMKVINLDDEVMLTEVLVRTGNKLIGSKVSDFIKLNKSIDSLCFTDCFAIQHTSDVVIDFSLPVASNRYLVKCLELAKPMVIGTTGFSIQEKAALQQAAVNIPIVFAPNMSMGINICYNLLELCAKAVGINWQVAINEIHHKHKKDAPSGTALKMREVIAKHSGLNEAAMQTNSIRAGDIVGEHSAFFIDDGERIELTHRVTNRAAFAKGALMAAKWLIDQKPGLYTMQDVIQDKLIS